MEPFITDAYILNLSHPKSSQNQKDIILTQWNHISLLQCDALGFKKLNIIGMATGVAHHVERVTKGIQTILKKNCPDEIRYVYC